VVTDFVKKTPVFLPGSFLEYPVCADFDSFIDEDFKSFLVTQPIVIECLEEAVSLEVIEARGISDQYSEHFLRGEWEGNSNIVDNERCRRKCCDSRKYWMEVKLTCDVKTSRNESPASLNICRLRT
jgi:hypothetical protein